MLELQLLSLLLLLLSLLPFNRFLLLARYA
jgi:hypothetical protein